MIQKEPTKRERQSAEKRNEIYKAAVSLFIEYGYEQTTMDDICRACGMSKGSVYHFFSKKAELLYYFFKELSKNSDDMLVLSESNLRSPARAILNYAVSISDAYEQLGFDLAVQLQTTYTSYLTSDVEDADTHFELVLAKFIFAAQKSGTFDDAIDCVEAAHFIHVCTAGCFRKWIFDGGTYSLTAVNQWFLPRILNGFVPDFCRIEQPPCPDRYKYVMDSKGSLLSSKQLVLTMLSGTGDTRS